ncbi:hypothetical protein Taro_013752 [Colocasia esculenta]|uniref:Uncharacterized protein n=1 Tax=Colocasia esculenta TaxID=4460 RepID=A0A843U7A8_COLES|nr:hypothetical protein [Colocasia esculenta]
MYHLSSIVNTINRDRIGGRLQVATQGTVALCRTGRRDEPGPGRDASVRRVHNASDPGVATSEIAAYPAVATLGGGPSPEKRWVCLTHSH